MRRARSSHVGAVPVRCVIRCTTQDLRHVDRMLSLLSHSAGLVLHAPLHGNAVAAQRSSAPQMAGPRPVQIIPSVLPADWANMGAECKRLEDAGVDRIQFDVMDGNFVPNLTLAASWRASKEDPSSFSIGVAARST